MQDLSPMQQMIYTGQFGTSAPMQQQSSGFNPYAQMQQPQQFNNIAPINPNINNSTTYYGANYVQQQSANNGFVFKPIEEGYQQQKYDYYNPYGNTFNPYGSYAQQQYSYGYQPYAQYGYTNYIPYITPVQQRQIVNEQTELMKIKYRLVDKFFHRETDEEKLDQMLNPYNKANIPTIEEQKQTQFAQYMNFLSDLARKPDQVETEYSKNAAYIRAMSENMHKALDSHSLCTFLEEDLWKLQREFWIAENISPKSRGRNLSAVYDSNDFNELLNLHRSSNPYINELLDNSRYDNNIDDLAMGMDLAYDRARRRQALLEGKVPSFISDEETQKRRSAWTNQIISQIYNKGGTPPNV